MYTPDSRPSIMELDTGEVRPAIADLPSSSSDASPWEGIHVEAHAAGRANELVDVVSMKHAIVVQVHGSSIIEWKSEEGTQVVTFQEGQAVLIPALRRFSAKTLRSGETLVITLDPRFLRFATHSLGGGEEPVELRFAVPVRDPMLHAMAVALHQEVLAGYPGGRVYGESMAAALSAHLVTRYGATTRREREGAQGGLTKNQLKRVLDYMHAHLAEDIPLSALAQEAGLSLFHFARCFKDSTGLSPHRYLVQCRVDRARELLISRKHTTSDIAVQVGFCDQSHLTLHFRRVFGVTPKQFRQQILGRGDHAE
ncbi:MAG: helix-turn-helix transcriptional regulator [Verrucomicrobiales bacterium]|nr:helix-turn-helix transcriptional regulator [Verrucomicrobiales bacterium]